MTHRQISRLLPWYANSTLEAEERERVEAHLADCPECRRELGELEALQTAEQEISLKAPMLPQDLLGRSFAEIEDYERTRMRNPDRTNRFVDRWRSIFSAWWTASPFPARAVMIGQAMLLVTVTTLYVMTPPSSEPVTLSGPGAGQGEHVAITLQFNKDATEEAIRETLMRIEGKIVAGPSALGLYTVQIPLTREQEAELDRLLKELRERPEIILFAERQP